MGNVKSKNFVIWKRVDGDGQIDVVIELPKDNYTASEMIDIINEANKEIGFRSDIQLSSNRNPGTGFFIRISNKDDNQKN